MRNRILLWAGVALTIALSACSHSTVYSHFEPTDGTAAFQTPQWHMDSIRHFDYSIADTDAAYQVVLYVRHTETYPYQNMWLFVSDSLRTDTIEFYLADDRGQWLGDKHHGFIEMPVLFEEHHRFPAAGTYHLSVQHGMRDTLLRGVCDVGVEVIKN